MPIYTYSCKNGHRCEQVRKVSERDHVWRCPQCWAVLQRVMDLPAPARDAYQTRAIMVNGSTVAGHFGKEARRRRSK